MSVENINEPTIETAQDTGAAVAAGVEQALEKAAPAIVLAAASTNPQLQTALLATQALEPAIVQLVTMFQAGQMTKDQLDANIETLKKSAVDAHAAWLASVGAPAV